MTIYHDFLNLEQVEQFELRRRWDRKCPKGRHHVVVWCKCSNRWELAVSPKDPYSIISRRWPGYWIFIIFIYYYLLDSCFTLSTLTITWSSTAVSVVLLLITHFCYLTRCCFVLFCPPFSLLAIFSIIISYFIVTIHMLSYDAPQDRNMSLNFYVR